MKNLAFALPSGWDADSKYSTIFFFSTRALATWGSFIPRCHFVCSHVCLVIVLVAARLLWKLEKAYSLGIPKNKLAHGVSQTEEEHAYARRYTIFESKGRSFRAGSVD